MENIISPIRMKGVMDENALKEWADDMKKNNPEEWERLSEYFNDRKKKLMEMKKLKRESEV